MSSSEHDAVVRRSFEKQTALFAGDDPLFARRSSSALAWLEPLDPEMIVLDVACGAAHAAEQVAPHVRQVVGLDLTRALLELGADRLRDAGITNVLLQEGSAAELPFLDASFDLVACRAALHHVPDPGVVVGEMARVCRPGGRVVAVDMVAPSAEVREAFDALHRRIDPSHAGVLLEGELADRRIDSNSSSVRSRPPVFMSMFRSLITTPRRANDGLTSAGTTGSTMSTLPPEFIARRQLSRILTQRSSPQSWMTLFMM